MVLDVSGLGRLLGDAHAIGAELARAADAYASSVQIAVARSQTAARLLASHRAGLTVAADAVAAALAPLPLDTLRTFVEDENTPGHNAAARVHATIVRIETFRRWGLTMLGEIAALPSIELSERMGQDGLALQQLARGIDRTPLVPDPGVPRFRQSMELEWPIEALEPLSFVLARLLEPLSASLERADRGAAALRLDLRLVDRTTHTRVLQLPAAMRDPKVLRTLLLLDLESHPPSHAIDIVTIEIDPVPGRVVQVLAARARAAVAGNGRDPHGAPARAGRRKPMRLADDSGYVAPGWHRDAGLRTQFPVASFQLAARLRFRFKRSLSRRSGAAAKADRSRGAHPPSFSAASRCSGHG